MNIFITGILGQIGSHIAEYFLNKNYLVYGIDNLSTGKKFHLSEHPNLNVTIGSISDCVLVKKIMEDARPDIVYHTAASYKDPNDWYDHTLTNCVGGAILIKNSLDLKVSRFVYFQTALC